MSETSVHLLCEYVHVANIWKDMTDWVGNFSKGTILFSNENTKFGFKGTNNNQIITKKAICTKRNSKIL